MRQTFVRQMLAAALPVPSDRTMTVFGIAPPRPRLLCKENYFSTERNLPPLPADHHFDSADSFSATYPIEADADRLRAPASSACSRPPIATRVNAVPISGAGEKVARKPARSAGRRKDGLRPAQSKLVQTSWP